MIFRSCPPGAFYRLRNSDASRHSADDPTAVSDCRGNGNAVRQRGASCASAYACRGSTSRWSLRGLSGGVMPPLLCSLLLPPAGTRIRWPAASRRPPSVRRSCIGRSVPATFQVCLRLAAPSTAKAAYAENVIARAPPPPSRCRGGRRAWRGPACRGRACQECVQSLFFSLAAAAKRRLNAKRARFSTRRRNDLYVERPGMPANPKFHF